MIFVQTKVNCFKLELCVQHLFNKCHRYTGGDRHRCKFSYVTEHRQADKSKLVVRDHGETGTGSINQQTGQTNQDNSQNLGN